MAGMFKFNFNLLLCFLDVWIYTDVPELKFTYTNTGCTNNDVVFKRNFIFLCVQ